MSVLAVFLAATVLAGLTPGQNAVTVTAPYSTRSIAVADLDGNPATGDWTDAATVTVALENGRTDVYGSALMSVKHDGTYLYVRESGKIDVPWTSATGTHFWAGFLFSPPSATGHHRDGMDGVFFGQSSYTPAPTYPLAPVDTNGGSRPPAKDSVQNAEGTLRYSGSAAPYDFTGEWRRPLNSGDAQDLVLATDGTTAYPFYVTTDSNGRGSSGGSIDHSVLTHENAMFFARVPPPETHDVAVTAASASPLSGTVGVVVTISATAANQGNVPETFDVKAYAGTILVGTQSVSGLAAGSTRSLSFSWDTASAAAASYAVRVDATAVAGETDLADNSYADGTVVLAPPVVAPALLRVVTSIDTHPTWGVPTRILVDGIPRNEWSLDWVKVPAGPHTVSFTDIANLETPADVSINPAPGETAVVNAVFKAKGWLRVVTDPAVPGTIYVNGVPRNEWGMWSAVPAGTYTVSFGAVRDYRPPAAQTVTVSAEQLTTVVGSYAWDGASPGPDPASYGLLRVTTRLSDGTPGVMTQIIVDGAPRDEWGLAWLKLAPGSHTLSFTDVWNFGTPADKTFAIVAGQTTTLEGVFVIYGWLRVTTEPPVPGTIYVGGVPMNDWGMWMAVPAGTYVVSFGPVPGFTAPPAQTAQVTAGLLTVVVGTYTGT